MTQAALLRQQCSRLRSTATDAEKSPRDAPAGRSVATRSGPWQRAGRFRTRLEREILHTEVDLVPGPGIVVRRRLLQQRGWVREVTSGAFRSMIDTRLPRASRTSAKLAKPTCVIMENGCYSDGRGLAGSVTYGLCRR